MIAKRPKNGGDILTKGFKNDPKSPSPILEPASIVEVAAGGKHSIVLTSTGLIYTFGYGD